MHIDVNAFYASLFIMLKGMLGIFIVTGIIVLTINVFSSMTRKKG